MNWTDRSYEWPCYSDRIMTSVMRNAIIAGETAVKATTEILFIVSWGGRRGEGCVLSTTNRPSGNTCDSKIYRRQVLSHTHCTSFFTVTSMGRGKK